MNPRYRFSSRPLQYAGLLVLAVALPALAWDGAGPTERPTEDVHLAAPASQPLPNAGARVLPLRPEYLPPPENSDSGSRAEAARSTPRAAV